MADNVIVNPSASYTVAAEDIGASVEVQRVKIVLGTVDVDGGNVGLTNPMPVTGTVAVPAGLSVSAQVSGTVTVVAGLSVSAQVSGTVTAAVPAGLSVSAVVSGTVTAVVTGPVSVSAMPAVSISVSAVLGTVVTVLGTVAVNVVAGGAAPGTTAATQSAISAQVVWLAPTQTMTATVNTIAVGFSVQALVTGPVSISVMPAVSISVSAALGTVITILGTQVVSVVPGLSVSAVVSGTVAAVVTGPVSISAMPAISISVSAVLGTVVTVLGTVSVSQAGLVFTTATPTVTATGPIVWLANTVTVTVTATVTGSLIISGVVPATTALVSGNTGLPVWPGTPPYAPVVVVIPSGAGAVSNAIYAFTIWTGGIVVAAGTTAFPVPAGKVLRIQNVQLAINSSAVTGGSVFVRVIGATATASFASGSIATQPHLMVLQMLVSAGVTAGSILGGQGDLIAGTTFGVVIQASTAFNIVSGVIMGYLF